MPDHGVPVSRFNLESVVEAAVRGALWETGGNVEAAARLLGVTKVTVYARCARHGIDVGEVRRLAADFEREKGDG